MGRSLTRVCDPMNFPHRASEPGEPLDTIVERFFALNRFEQRDMLAVVIKRKPGPLNLTLRGAILIEVGRSCALWNNVDFRTKIM